MLDLLTVGPKFTRQQQLLIDICCPRSTSAANLTATATAVDWWDRQIDGHLTVLWHLLRSKKMCVCVFCAWLQTLCSVIISLSVSFLPFVGSTMSFLIIFSTHSNVTTFPLQKMTTICYKYICTTTEKVNLLTQSAGHCLLIGIRYLRCSKNSTRNWVVQNVIRYCTDVSDLQKAHIFCKQTIHSAEMHTRRHSYSKALCSETVHSSLNSTSMYGRKC